MPKVPFLTAKDALFKCQSRHLRSVKQVCLTLKVRIFAIFSACIHAAEHLFRGLPRVVCPFSRTFFKLHIVAVFRHVAYTSYFLSSFSRSLISASSFSSADGAGGAGGAAGSSSFFFERLLMPFTIMNTQKAMMIKSRVVWIKLP